MKDAILEQVRRTGCATVTRAVFDALWQSDERQDFREISREIDNLLVGGTAPPPRKTGLEKMREWCQDNDLIARMDEFNGHITFRKRRPMSL